MKILQGAKSPYSGVLVPESNYRLYQRLELENSELTRLATEVQQCEAPTWPIYLGVALLGVLGGMALSQSTR